MLTLSTRILADVLTGTQVLTARQVSAWWFAKLFVCRRLNTLFKSFLVFRYWISK